MGVAQIQADIQYKHKQADSKQTYKHMKTHEQDCNGHMQVLLCCANALTHTIFHDALFVYIGMHICTHVHCVSLHLSTDLATYTVQHIAYSLTQPNLSILHTYIPFDQSTYLRT